MSSSSNRLFDPAILPAALETDDADTLVSFYEMFVLVTRDSWQQLANAGVDPDVSEVGGIAHKLKSSSASIGAMQLAEALSVLEDLAVRRDADAVHECIAQTARTFRESINAVQAHIDLIRQS